MQNKRKKLGFFYDIFVTGVTKMKLLPIKSVLRWGKRIVRIKSLIDRTEYLNERERYKTIFYVLYRSLFIRFLSKYIF